MISRISAEDQKQVRAVIDQLHHEIRILYPETSVTAGCLVDSYGSLAWTALLSGGACITAGSISNLLQRIQDHVSPKSKLAKARALREQASALEAEAGGAA